MTTRHEFLAQLHLLLNPDVYLEVGVQLGTSLNLAHAAKVAIGIDPYPLTSPRGNQRIFDMTSNEFFTGNQHVWGDPGDQLDLAFIDGSHLFEDALQDFINISKYAHHGTVVVFDDVLPYNQAIAAREQPPGDWTGDVWKVWYALREEYDDCLEMNLVDVFPTGALLVYGFHEHHVAPNEFTTSFPDLVPDEIISRTIASQPEGALAALSSYLFHTGS